MKRAKYVAPTFAVGAFMFDWTGITNLSISPIRDDLLTSTAGVQFQDLALWANVMILFGFVMKLVRVIITSSVANIWNGYKRPYARLFQTSNIWCRAILGVSGNSCGA
jgi:hypothetical protein